MSHRDEISRRASVLQLILIEGATLEPRPAGASRWGLQVDLFKRLPVEKLYYYYTATF